MQSQILAFGTEADLWQHASRYPEAVAKALSSKTVINLSFLQILFPNDIQQRSDDNKDSPQNAAVTKLMHLLLLEQQQQQSTSSSSSNLKYLECSGLRHVSGRWWLDQIPTYSLQTLDLSGCTNLDQKVLIECLHGTGSQLKHLNLTGCTKVSNSVLLTIEECHPQLEGLWLGGCSQAIGRPPFQVLDMLKNMSKLKHLDLQMLNRITDDDGRFMDSLPSSMESLNLTACRELRLQCRGAHEATAYYLESLSHNRSGLDHWNTAPTFRHDKMMHLVLDLVGLPRAGLCRGVLAYFAMGRQLREVHLSGCENIHDWEVEALAVTCAGTLTCLQMRACRISDASLKALATHCRILGEVDVSACFRVGDEGIMALSEPRRFPMGENNNKLGKGNFRLRVLRLASLPGLTDRGVTALRNIDSLHVLDVEDCIDVRPSTLLSTILHLPLLIDINANGIAEEKGSFSSLLRDLAKVSPHRLPQGLRMVNRRFYEWLTPAVFAVNDPHGNTMTGAATAGAAASCDWRCCTVRTKVQRLDSPIAPAIMYYCIDCKLLPTMDRGVCASCVSQCHKGHQTFIGAWTRFYCDCPFGVTGNDCDAIFPSPICSIISSG